MNDATGLGADKSNETTETINPTETNETTDLTGARDVISQNVHEDGLVHKAAMYPTAENGGAAQEVFVVKGELVMREDGTIDTEASSNEIYYKDVDGQTHIASPDNFQRADAPVSVEEILAADEGTDRVNTTVAPRFFMDDEVKVTGADGNTYNGVVSGTFKSGDRNEITVDYEDTDGNMKRVTLPYDELARMNGYDVEDEANTPMAENNSALQTPTEAVANGDETNGENEIQPIGKGAFGNIYNQFKGKVKDAINFLTRKKEGVAIGALHHKDIGDIDLVWGNKVTMFATASASGAMRIRAE